MQDHKYCILLYHILSFHSISFVSDDTSLGGSWPFPNILLLSLAAPREHALMFRLAVVQKGRG